MTDEQRSPVDAAIDELERRQMEQELAALDERFMQPVPILSTAHRLDEQNEIRIGAVPGDLPTLLLWDSEQGAFRAVQLPDGSAWRLVPDRSAIWTPGAPA